MAKKARTNIAQNEPQKIANNPIDSESGDVLDSGQQDVSVHDDEPTLEDLRRGRQPLSGADRLTAPKRPGFIRRWVNDLPGNVDRFFNAGYRPVKAKRGEQLHTGFTRTGDGSPMQGSNTMKSVGGGTRAILMEIPIDLYKEDRAAQDARTDTTETGIKEQFAAKASKHKHEDGATGRVYGDVSITRDGEKA